MNTSLRNDRGETEPGVAFCVVVGFLAFCFLSTLGKPLPDPPHTMVVNSQTGTNMSGLDGATKGGPSVVLER